ncbi:MAG: hypothetical protein GX432_00245 [Candidatus Atribacteria bacterium]|nr:hypothetical protein [Candidatus Atribacteria bacterium]
MVYDQLLDVLKKINNTKESKVPEDILAAVLKIVMRNPLDDDRRKCQDQIKLILSQKWSGVENDN